MRKYKESVDAAALSKLSRDELAALDQQIETMLRENNVYVDEIYSYQEEHSGVRHIQFDLSGDWKHEHLKTKMLMEQQGWSLYSKEEIGESDSDYYEAHYDFVYDKDFETYANNMFTPEERAQLGKLFEEDYSPSLLNDLVNDYRYEYSAETHNEIWNKILEMYNDEDLANDVLAALEDGEEDYEDDDDRLFESETSDDTYAEEYDDGIWDEDDDEDDCDTDYFDEIVANAVAFFANTKGATEESFKEYLREEYPNVADWMLVPLWDAFVCSDGKTVTFQEI